MKKRTALVLLAAIPAVGVAGWMASSWLARTKARGVATPVVEEPAEPATGEVGLVVVREPAVGERQVAPPPEPQAAQATSVPGEFTPPEGSIWIEGRVVFPPGTPEDEVASVTARGHDFERGRRTHTVDVAPDGSFRVAVAAGSPRAWLSVAGRYLFSWRRASAVDVRAPPPPIELEPELGGRIAGTLRLPAGAPGSALASARVSALDRDARDRVRGPLRVAELEPDGRFALDALPEGVYDVAATADELADSPVAEVTVAPGATIEQDIALTAGARLAGRVTDPLGNPVEATVIRRLEGGWSGLTRTDEDGTFDARGVQPGETTLVAHAPGCVDGELGLGALVDGEVRVGLLLVVDPGLAVAGEVHGPDGAPVDGARVELRLRRGLGRHFGEADANGRFRIQGLEPATYLARASGRPTLEGLEREGGERGPRRWTEVIEVSPPTEGLVLTLSPGTAVAGTVVDDAGAPLERFRIQAEPLESEPLGGARVLERFRDRGGRFTLEGLGDGAWLVTATADGHGTSEPSAVDARGEPIDLRLVVPRGARLAGVVRDAQGEPILGARVVLRTMSVAALGELAWNERTNRTNLAGEFELDEVPPGTVTLTASAPGDAPSAETELELAPAEERRGVELTLAASGGVMGVVILQGPLPEDLHVEATRASGGEVASARADRSGRFELDDLAPGTWQVEPALDLGADDSAFVAVVNASRTVEVESGRTVEVALGGPPPHPIQVRGAITRGGAGVAGTLVHGLAERGSAGFPRGFAARTQADGRYELTVGGPGRYVFSIGSRWELDARFTREVPDEAVVALSFDLPAGRLAGVVVDERGGPVRDQRVVASRTDGDAEPRSTQTDAQGRFEIAGLEAGTWVLRTESPDGRYARGLLAGVELDERREGLRIELARPGSVEGVVVDAKNEPLPGAPISVTTLDGVDVDGSGGVTSDAAGRFRCEGLAPGIWVVRARAGERASGPATVQVFAGRASDVRLTVR